MSRDDPLAARLERLAGFAAVLEAPGFVAGEHVTLASAPGVCFSEGSLMGAFGRGLVLGIVRRAGVLMEGTDI